MRRWIGRIAGLGVLAMVALLAVDLRPARLPAAPTLLGQRSGVGSLQVGAAVVDIEAPVPSVTAGYGPRDRYLVRSSKVPLQARALAVQVGSARWLLLSVDLLEVDAQLPAEVVARLGGEWGTPWICATHTHTGMGGYDPGLLPQVAGTGRYAPAAREALISALVNAGREAEAHVAAASLGIGEGDLATLIQNRDQAGPVDDRLLRLRFATDGGSIEVARLAAHPTLVARDTNQLDPDYPGLLARAFSAWESSDGGALGLVLQGALGDASVRREVAATPEGFTQAVQPLWPPVSTEAESTALEVESVEVSLPPPDIAVVPSWVRKGANNLAPFVAPSTATVSVLHLGRITLVAIPGEVTFDAAQILLEPARRQARPGEIVSLVGLCNGYLGYVDSPEHVKSGTGETARTYFGPDLVDRLRGGVERALASSPLSSSPLVPIH